jgi:hypothetical protein
MTERSNDNQATGPLPRDCLPESQPREGAPVWDARVRRIMAAAEPELRRIEGRRSAVEAAPWWSVMGMWWKPAGALAAASVALLLLLGRRDIHPGPPPGSIPLGLVASEGDPVTLWGVLGVQADPVLALIAVRGDVTGPSAPSSTQREENP